MNAVAAARSNLLSHFGHSLTMRTPTLWTAAASILALAWAPGAGAADFELTAVETQRVARDEIVIRANLEPGARRGTVRAAMLINAPPDVVFQMMTHCADALKYVPHLRVCQVRERAPDLSWE